MWRIWPVLSGFLRATLTSVMNIHRPFNILQIIFLTVLCFAYPVDCISERIKIGISTPLTGDGSPYGIDIRNGIILANSRLSNDAYELVIEDEKSPKDAVSIAQKFIGIDKIKYVLGPAVNATLFSAGPVYDRAGVVCVGLGTSGDQKGIGTNLFRIYPADQESANILGPWVYDRYSKIGIVSDQDEYTALIERTLVSVNQVRSSPRELFIEQDGSKATDYVPLFLRVKSRGIDALVLNPATEQGFIRMVKQLASAGIKVPIFTFVLPSSSTVQSALGELLNNIIYADLPELNELLSKDGKLVMEDFKKRFGEPNSVPLIAALGYESFRILDEAIKSGKSVPEYLRGLKVEDSIIGRYSFDDDGAVQGINFSLLQIHVVNGKIEKSPVQR